MQRNPRRALLGIVVILVSVVCWNVWRSVDDDAKQSRFTSQQILARTVALFPIVTPLAATSSYSAERQMVYKRQSTGRYIWIIDCMDARDQRLGHCIWDADTGQLIEVLCIPPSPSTQNSLRPRQAAIVAASWLRALVPQDNPTGWHLMSSPEHNQHHWTAKFRDSSRTVTVRIEEGGSLSRLHVYLGCPFQAKVDKH